MRWTRQARTARRLRGPDLAGVAPDLRVQLPLLWPEGPDGPIDQRELAALARHYARSGRSVAALLADLDGLCDVVGIATPSAAIERSTVAWSDAFVEQQRDEAVPDSYDEVTRRVTAHSSTAWPGLPEAHLVFVSGAREALAATAGLLRRHFPGSAVEVQPELGRVVACVESAPDLSRALEAFRASCAEHLTASPVITVETVPADRDAAVGLLRTAG